MWILALFGYEGLMRDVERAARRFRDLVDKNDVISATSVGVAEAMKRFDPELGRFPDFARPFVVGALIRTARSEIRWRMRHVGTDELEASAPDETDLEAFRSELKALIGEDAYHIFMSHVAWGESLRSLARNSNRSFRSVRESYVRARHIIRDRLGFTPGEQRSKRRSRAPKALPAPQAPSTPATSRPSKRADATRRRPGRS